MSPNDKIRVLIHNPRDPIPGEIITSTVTLALSNALSVSEFTITIFGRAYTSISRTYIIRNFSYEWYGQGFFFKRFVVLIRSPTILPPGEHSFPFRFQLPASTEQVRGNWRFFNKWKERLPFPGKNGVHPLPGTMAMSCNQTWGFACAHVEYIVSATVKRGPETSFLTSMPKGSTVLNVSTRARPDLPLTPAAGPWCQITRSIKMPNGSANVTCRLPRVLVQRSQIPVYFKTDQPLELTGLKIKIHVVYLVRGRHMILPEKRTKCIQTMWLVKTETRSTELTSNFMLTKLIGIPDGVPTTFLTFNIACVAHFMEIKYRVAAPGSNTEVKDLMKDIPVQVQSWVGGDSQGSGDRNEKTENGFGAEVFNEEEYRKWVAERKKTV